MAIDDVQDLSPRVQYTAAAAQTVFDYPFPIFANGDLRVYVDSVLQAVDTDYTVQDAGEDNGGTITFLSAMAGGEVVTIYRDIAIERTSDYQQNGPWGSAATNAEFNRIVMMMQQLEARIGRAIRFSEVDSVASADLELSPISAWLSRYLYVNSSGELEPAAALSTTTLSQSIIGALLNPQTGAESSAGVTPVNYAKYPSPWKDISRFVSDNTGATDVATEFNRALAAEKNIIIPEGSYRIGSPLVYRDGMNIEGSGIQNCFIKGNLSNLSFFRSSYGETPTIGQRPTGVRIANLAIYPQTAATITSGSIGVNFRNAQYCTLERVLMQYVDKGVATDQIAQYNVYDRLIVQVANTGMYLESIGGGNRLMACDIGGNVVCIDMHSGTYELLGTTAEATDAGCSYIIRAGRAGGANATVHADGLYVEGLNAATVTLQLENSVTRSAFRLHRHSTLGTVVNNAGDNVLIEIPGQGYYTPVYKAQRVEFAAAIDGSAQASMRSNGGNTLEARNAANNGFSDFYARTFIAPENTITYSASMTPDALAGQRQIITATNGTAFTINAPSNPVTGVRMTITIRNASGGALGAITWNAVFKMAAFTAPANGFSRSVDFQFNGSAWVQVAQTGVDVPN